MLVYIIRRPFQLSFFLLHITVFRHGFRQEKLLKSLYFLFLGSGPERSGSPTLFEIYSMLFHLFVNHFSEQHINTIGHIQTVF